MAAPLTISSRRFGPFLPGPSCLGSIAHRNEEGYHILDLLRA